MPNKNVFDRFIDRLNDLENSFVNLISKIIPILVPLIPAYVSYNHVKNELGFSNFFAFTYAAVVEGLGYASIYKALQFWEWNRRFSKEEKKSPFTLAIIIYITYIFVILWVNVMLDWQTGVVWYRIVAVGAISLLSVPAGLLVSISAMHNERVKEHEEKLEQLKDAREEAKKQREEEKKEQKEKEQQGQQPREEKQDQKKLSKFEIAYNFVVDYYSQYENIPTNKIVSDSASVALGTAFSAIQKFVIDNAQTLLNAGKITQKDLEDTNKKYYGNIIKDFVKRNNRFLNTEEVGQLSIPSRELARFIVDNRDWIVQNNLVDEETIQQAEQIMSGEGA